MLVRHNGLTVQAITLWMLGGVTELEGESPDAGADLRIALARAFLGAAAAVSHAGGPAVVTAALM